MNKANVAGLKIDEITKQEFLVQILKRINNGEKTFAITPYSEFLFYTFQDPKLLDVFNKADFSLADGIGIFWAKRYLEIPLTAKSYCGKILQASWQLKYSLAAIIFNPQWIKRALPEKIVGADLVYDLCKLAGENNLRVYFLGGHGDTPKLAAKKINQKLENDSALPQGSSSISYSNKNPTDTSVTEDINRIKPDMLFVAYGPVKQERWIVENLGKIDIKMAIGIGGSFDYIAGIKSAPPKFIRYSGLEWLWRLITQPYRVKRIFNATFGLMSCLWHYKVFNSMPFRKNVAAIILNSENKILIFKRPKSNFNYYRNFDSVKTKGNDYWQFPQGGISLNEKPEDSARREVWEETGITELELLKISEKTNTYEWENGLRSFAKNKKIQYKGQTQNIVYFKFIGNENSIRGDGKELTEHKWVSLKDLELSIHNERLSLVKIVIDDLKDLA